MHIVLDMHRASDTLRNMTLDQFLSDQGMTNHAFGALVGRDASSISRLRRGETRPDWETVRLIYDATGGAVTANDFLPPAPAPAEAAQ